MSTALFDVVDAIAPKMCVELLDSYGVHLTGPLRHDSSMPPQSDDVSVAGMIGFTGEQIKGTVVLVTSFAVLAAARPSAVRSVNVTAGSASDWLLVRDWAAELANQLLGRITNRLARFGVVIRSASPSALSGRALTYARPASKDARPYVFTARSENLWFWFDAVYDRNLQVNAVDDRDAPREGEIVFLSNGSSGRQG